MQEVAPAGWGGASSGLAGDIEREPAFLCCVDGTFSKEPVGGRRELKF